MKKSFLESDKAIKNLTLLIFTTIIVFLLAYNILIARPSSQDIKELILLFGGLVAGYYGGKRR